jgi:hypothetical protein
VLLRDGVQTKFLILILLLIFMRDGAGADERDVKAPGRTQTSWRGMSGRDAAKAVRAMDGPSRRAPGTTPEGGNRDEVAAQPVANGFGYFFRKKSDPP